MVLDEAIESGSRFHNTGRLDSQGNQIYTIMVVLFLSLNGLVLSNSGRAGLTGALFRKESFMTQFLDSAGCRG